MKKLLFLASILLFTSAKAQETPTGEIISVKKVTDKGRERVKVTYKLTNLQEVMSIQLAGSTLKDIDIIEGEQVFYDNNQLLTNLEYHFVFTMNGNRRSIITDHRTFKLE